MHAGTHKIKKMFLIQPAYFLIRRKQIGGGEGRGGEGGGGRDVQAAS